MLLRVYNLSLDSEYNNYYDISINLEENSLYLRDLLADNTYLLRLGILDKAESFYKIIESNTVKMPSNSVTNILDQEWMIVEAKMEEIYILSSRGLTNDKRKYSSSDVIKKETEKHRKEELRVDLKIKE